MIGSGIVGSFYPTRSSGHLSHASLHLLHKPGLRNSIFPIVIRGVLLLHLLLHRDGYFMSPITSFPVSLDQECCVGPWGALQVCYNQVLHYQFSKWWKVNKLTSESDTGNVFVMGEGVRAQSIITLKGNFRTPRSKLWLTIHSTSSYALEAKESAHNAFHRHSASQQLL